MQRLKRHFICAPLLAALLFPTLNIAQSDGEQIFLVPYSTLQAAERRLAKEEDPYKRLQLVLRWIKIVEELEKRQEQERDTAATEEEGKTKGEQLVESKRKIVTRIENEVRILEKTPDLSIAPLYRELGFRYGELAEHKDSIQAFLKLDKRTPDDDLALGDAFFANDQVQEAINAYEIAGQSPRLKAQSAYKRGWSYMRLNMFGKALEEFGVSLQDDPHSTAQLKEEAYRDRLRPYLETFNKESFSKEDALEFQNIAKIVHKDNPERQREIYVEALKALIDGFTSKSRIELAQNVFFFLSQAIEDTTEVLLIAAPTWIKVYRGRLNHPEVTKIINALPKEPLSIDSSSTLRAELYNTAVFYETYTAEDDVDEDAVEKAKSLEVQTLLYEVYAKYFVLYPTDQEADPLRVNFGKRLLERGEAGQCLSILEGRSRNEPEVEAVASSLEGKCELKHLDELYAQKHSEFFYKKLQRALLETKIYTRKDLGITTASAFASLASMLVGSIQKSTDNEILRNILQELLKDYPLTKESPTYLELQTTDAELRFKDLLASRQRPSQKAPKFFEIYQNANKGTDVAQKALTNSILMAVKKEALDRCDTFREIYPSEFDLEKPVFDKCIEMAEHFLDLERERGYWYFREKSLNSTQRLRLGLLEMGLKIKGGRQRVEALNTEQSRTAIELWEGVSPKRIKTNPQWQALQGRKQKFVNSLSKIKFNQIGREVPRKTRDYENLDAALVQFFESEEDPLWRANTLEARAEAASTMANWISNLPEPPGLDEVSLAEYREKAKEISDPWSEKAEARRTECSEIAHALSVDFKEANEEFCKEDTPRSTFRKYVQDWNETIPRSKRISKIVAIIIRKAEGEEDIDRAKYYLLRALDLSKNDRERARAFLTFAKITDKELFWNNAAALDGSLVEPIEWLRKQAEGNPFFEGLYDWQLRSLRQAAQR